MDPSWHLARKGPALRLRADLLHAIRRFFTDRGFLEVDTPLRIPSPLPESHIDAIASGAWFLQTSPEGCMKRLLAAGFSRIFQICKCFREGERGFRHLPEFTMLEWYARGATYRDMMTDCEELAVHVCRVLGREGFSVGGRRITVGVPWPRLSVRDAFLRHAGMTVEEAVETDRYEEVLAAAVEPRLGLRRPLILYDYPVHLAALARRKPEDPTLAERFEIYVGGVELVNAFSELADAQEQRQRFAMACEERKRKGRPAYAPAERFLEALPFMGDAAGAALGVDRLVMLLVDAARIDDVVAFTPEDL